MNTTTNQTDPVDAEFTDSTLAPAPAARAALVPQENPFERMALIAMEKGAMDQMERLLDLQLKWDAEQQRKAYVAAMADFKAQPIKIVKGKLVEFTTRDGDVTSYRHATLASVVDAVVSAMGRNGLSHRWDVNQEGGQVRVTCSITHRGGHSESVSMQAAPDSSGKKNGIQQVASTVTYLQRYTLMALAGVAAEDMEDDDGQGHSAAEVTYITDEQAKILKDLVDEYVNNPGKFMDWVSSQIGYKANELADIPSASFDAVHAQLGRIRKQKIEGPANG